MSDVWYSDIQGSVSARQDETLNSTNYPNRSRVIIAEQNRQQHLRELVEVFIECISKDWDGEGARPISIGAYTDTLSFIKKIPTDFSLPDILPESDGTIGLQWYQSSSDYMIFNFDGTGFINLVGRENNNLIKHRVIPVSTGLGYENVFPIIQNLSSAESS